MIPFHMLNVDRGRPFRCATFLACVVTVVTHPVAAQRGLTAADSALVGRILLAEDRRDSSSAAFDAGKRHRDPRIQYIARRAEARVRDSKFSLRDSIPGAPKSAPPPTYAEPAWRLRFRALTAKSDCAAIRASLADSAWAVRLHAVDLAPSACAKDSTVLAVVRAWATTTRSTQRQAGSASWHPAAHAIVALARMSPADARAALPILLTSPSPWIRKYSARAAGVLSDTASLVHLAADADHNVMEAAIDALASVASHSADDQYLAALGSSGYQSVRAAARALEGSPRSGDVSIAALAAARRLRADSSETSRDARAAVMELLAEFATPAQVPDLLPLTTDFDCEIANLAAAIVRKQHANASPKCTPLPIPLPADALSLALGRDARIRVTLADSSGGGSFVARLRGDVAPIMAARILALARSGYYNGLVWHRVEPDFVVQGGGLDANEYMGNPRFMRDELGTVPHVRGTVGMSTRGHDTGDGQWFFNLRDNRRLDRDYTLFAEVVEGLAVVDGILEGDVIARMDVLRATR
jgi:cyclophilin family peptidyl-prolyl cis-trans isomerase